jgi:hypothetical protein
VVEGRAGGSEWFWWVETEGVKFLRLVKEVVVRLALETLTLRGRHVLPRRWRSGAEAREGQLGCHRCLALLP